MYIFNYLLSILISYMLFLCISLTQNKFTYLKFTYSETGESYSNIQIWFQT